MNPLALIILNAIIFGGFGAVDDQVAGTPSPTREVKGMSHKQDITGLALTPLLPIARDRNLFIRVNDKSKKAITRLNNHAILPTNGNLYRTGRKRKNDRSKER